MSTPRPSYRAQVVAIPLDPSAETLLRAIPDADGLRVTRLHAGTAGELAGADMVVFVAVDARAVTRDPLVGVAAAARAGGLLVAAVLTETLATGGAEDQRQGLAALREAVDMLVVTHDETLPADLLDVLRGGRADLGPAAAPPAGGGIRPRLSIWDGSLSPSGDPPVS